VSFASSAGGQVLQRRERSAATGNATYALQEALTLPSIAAGPWGDSAPWY